MQGEGRIHPAVLAQVRSQIDFRIETAILIYRGMRGSLDTFVGPIAAVDTPQKTFVRYTVWQLQGGGLAVNFPFAILAVASRGKPITVTSLSEDEIMGAVLQDQTQAPVPIPTVIPETKTLTVTGSRITVPERWVVRETEQPPDLMGRIRQLAVTSTTAPYDSGAHLAIDSLPLASRAYPGANNAPEAVLARERQEATSPPRTRITGELLVPWWGFVYCYLSEDGGMVSLEEAALYTIVQRYRFHQQGMTYDRLTLSYRSDRRAQGSDAHTEAEVLSVLASWQTNP